MNDSHEATVSRRTISFTCDQHPRKPQTDVETCGRCGRKDRCDTLAEAVRRLGSPEPTPEATPESERNDRCDPSAKPRINQKVIEALRRTQELRTSKSNRDMDECGTAAVTTATPTATRASVRARVRQAYEILGAVLTDLEEEKR